jgi:signal transduction histidine kinase
MDTHQGEVLIVEDTPASLKLLSDLLERAGYAVRQAPDGELALWSAQSRPPELILLDVRMPGIDGFEVCRRLKHDSALCDIPVIFLSAQSDTDDKLRGFEAGAIDFIGKPYQSQEVLARCAAHIGLARARHALAAANHDLAGALAQLQATRDELRRAERLAALGAMVAGVAHELNTPIGNCVMAASTLEQRAQDFALAAGGPMRRTELTGFIDDALQASALLTRNLAASARLIDSFKQVASDQAGALRRRFDLAELVDEAMRGHAARVRAAGASLQLALEPGVEMDSYPLQVCQVLAQLVNNALIHGIGDGGGTLRIEAAGDGAAVRLSVCDDGAGIAGADVARVFDPFFTSRLGQGSSGLGLHIVHNLVSNVLGGHIDVNSRAGDTRFTVHCPRQAPVLASAHAGRELP